MPFTLEDLQRIRVRVGTGEKALGEMSDNQFTAWPFVTQTSSLAH